MHYFCTLFDSGYLTRGLAMYQSLVDVQEDFFLYIIAFDEEAYDILTKMALPFVRVISLGEFESERLLRVKKSRTRQEYSWTCGSFSIKYVMDAFNVPELTYLDADLFFFHRPSVLLDEFEGSGADVLITEHRYTPEYDQTETSGKFCVQFMTFKNTAKGNAVLNWWCDRCEEWCYARSEDGKFGDQKYLDDWETRFDCVHVLQHLGGGVAPWNVQQYDVTEGPHVNGVPVIFYHFHGLRWYGFHTFDLSTYKLSKKCIQMIYDPYVAMLQQQCKRVELQTDGDFHQRYAEKPRIRDFKDYLRYKKERISRFVRGTLNVIYR